MPLKPKLVLKGGKEKHIRHGHPWIFASAISGNTVKLAKVEVPM